MAVTPGTSTPPPNPNNIVATNYVVPGIVFAKVTDSNLAVANSQDGGDDNSLTDIITPVTLATGKITSDDTTAIVFGYDTRFLTDFADGDYLFYYNNDATPILLGKVQSRDSDTQITLTDDSSTTLTNQAYCGKSNSVIPRGENLLVRFPVIPQGNGIIIPNWNEFRQAPVSQSSFNKTSLSSITTYSAVGDPTIYDPSGANVSFSITPIFPYAQVQNANGYKYIWTQSNSFPNFIYAIINPYGLGSTRLPANTLYKLFTNQNTKGIVATIAYPVLFMQTVGYAAFDIAPPVSNPGPIASGG
jgi:hypothetical protein